MRFRWLAWVVVFYTTFQIEMAKKPFSALDKARLREASDKAGKFWGAILQAQALER